MNEYRAMTTCEGSQKNEKVKSILEEMDAILNELGQELARIDSAIYSPRVAEDEKRAKDPADMCLLGILNRQRETAQKLHDLTIHIREGLW